MGRFGNVMLTGGETDLDARRADAGEVVRFYFTNTANTRLFNVAIPGARMKLVGGDSGRYERETFVDEVLLAPSERAIVDVALRHAPARSTSSTAHPDHTYVLGTITVDRRAGRRIRPSPQFEDAPHQRRADRRTGADRRRPRPRARQDAGLRVADAAPLRRPGRRPPTPGRARCIPT